MIQAQLIFEHKDKYIAKINGEICHITKNKFTTNLKIKNNYYIDATERIITINSKVVKVYEILDQPVLKSESGERNGGVNSKTPRERFYEILPLLKDDLHKAKFSKYYKLAIALSLMDHNLKKDLDEVIQLRATKKPNSLKEKHLDQKKFLIKSTELEKYKIGFLERNGQLINIKHLGKAFEFRDNANGKHKNKFKNGDRVCYVYYEINKPNAEDFLEATYKYYEIIDFIQTNGIKPRHKAAEITIIKDAKILCDSRVKIEGNSWIAYNEEYMWYINHKLSSIQMENNIKINNQFAQCWRIPLRQVLNLIDDLTIIDLILFKSSAIPNSQKTLD